MFLEFIIITIIIIIITIIIIIIIIIIHLDIGYLLPYTWQKSCFWNSFYCNYFNLLLLLLSLLLLLTSLFRYIQWSLYTWNIVVKVTYYYYYYYYYY